MECNQNSPERTKTAGDCGNILSLTQSPVVVERVITLRATV